MALRAAEGDQGELLRKPPGAGAAPGADSGLPGSCEISSG